MKQFTAVFMGILFALVLVAGQEAIDAISGESRIAASSIMPPNPETGTFGQNHYYAVTFDEEGEAAVALRMEFQNTKQTPLSTIQLEIPGTTVRLINAFQEVQEKKQRCGSWTVPVPFASDTVGEYVPKEYYDKCSNWYDNFETRYYTVDVKEEKLSKSGQYTFTLQRPVSGQDTSTLVLYYKATGYTHKSLGAFDFDFETAKLNQDINSVRVAVTVLEGLSMAGVESQVEYRGNQVMDKMAASAPVPQGIVSQDLQDFSNQIKWANGLVKTTRGLDPLESFHVTGTYARSKWALHSTALIVTLIIVLLVIFGVVKGVKKVISMPAVGKGKPANTKAAAVIAGVVSALCMFAVWVAVFFLSAAIGVAGGYAVGGLVVLFGGIFGILLSLALFVVPPLLIGWKYGMVEGVITFGAMLGTLLVLAILVVVIFAILGTSGSYSPSSIMY